MLLFRLPMVYGSGSDSPYALVSETGSEMAFDLQYVLAFEMLSGSESG